MVKLREVRLGHAANCSALGNVLNVLIWSQVTVALVWAAAEAWPTRRRRSEPDGESRLTAGPEGALVRLEGEGNAEFGPGREAHLHITEACGLTCTHCYQRTSAQGPHVPLATVKARLDALAQAGVMRVALGGGEPLRHPELPAIAAHARGLGLGIGTTTSGVGALPDMRGFDQVNVSLDTVADFTSTRGYDGVEGALATIRRLSAQTRVGVNIVMTRTSFAHIVETVRAAVSAGARDVQLLRLKPVGRGAEAYAAHRLTPEQALAVWPLAQALMAEHPNLSVRLDCASLPFLVAHKPDAQRLRDFGFRGCWGQSELVSVDAAGRSHPCSFVPQRAGEDWALGAEICGDCAYRDVCRGGCHAVAEHVTGARFAPDPECPRVLGLVP